MTVHELDTRRLLCPMPVIRTQDAVEDYQTGDVVHVFATDPGVKQDIPAWCRVNGHEVLDIIEHEDDIEIVVKVGSS